MSATADLVTFDEEFEAAQELVQDTTAVVNDGWESITEVGAGFGRWFNRIKVLIE